MWDRLVGVLEPGVRLSGSPLERRLRRISALEKREEARAFLDDFAAASNMSDGARQRRWADIRRGLKRGGWYEHTPEELAFGARLAWRNHARCIGRLYWESLEVADCRDVTAPDAIAARIVDHLDIAQNDGRVRSIISIFPSVREETLPAWIESPQIVQYACHVLVDGSLLGDRQNAEATRIATSLGWRPPQPRTAFDILPVRIRDDKDRRVLFELPHGLVQEVPIGHPQHPGISALGLKWYSVPIVSGMILTIGGVEYPCAPFNGFYLCTEIASRNFADEKRYDLLRPAARAIGLNPDAPGPPLWKDTVLTELNRAVLHSYNEAGVTVLDHHTAAAQYMTFHAREQAAGRRVAGDWRWILPPQAGSAHDVFHLKMRNFHPVPNYYMDRGSDGLQLMPWYGDRRRNRWRRSTDRIQRRLKIWKRMAW